MSRPTFFATPEAFRAWLVKHHAQERELTVGFWKRGTGKPSLTWPESVDQALCFGWIDGVRRSLSDEAYTIRFTPRKPTSIWSAINVAKVKALEAAGLMTAAGRAAFERRTEARTGVYSFERLHPPKLTAAEAAQLKGKARAFFEAQPNWYRRAALHLVVSAKKPETRARRLATLIADSAAGRTIAPLTRKPKARR